jgi:hypothetical protein
VKLGWQVGRKSTGMKAIRVASLMRRSGSKAAWFARLRGFARGKSHAMSTIRRSIAKARKDAGLR